MEISFQVSSKIVESPELLRDFLSAVKAAFPESPPALAMHSPPSVMPQQSPAVEHGPNVREYLNRTGQARFRLTNEERAKYGEDREAAALARMDAAEAAVATVTEIPPDDGKAFDWQD